MPRPLLAALLLAATAAFATGPDQPSLAALRWTARPLVVFADTPDDPRFLQQMRMLADRPDDLAERKVVILTDTDPAADGALRQQLRPREFGLVLIDIDGSIVQRRPVPTSAREIINLIDRTPSRREETGSRRP
ncbi:MAG: DUF4174 domain-containing protein [Amaricoccus sp.]